MNNTTMIVAALCIKFIMRECGLWQNLGIANFPISGQRDTGNARLFWDLYIL